MKKIIVFLLLISFSINAVDQERKLLESSTTYQAISDAMWTMALCSLPLLVTSGDSNGFLQEGVQGTLAKTTTLVCSLFASGCVNKFCKRLAPISSLWRTRKPAPRSTFALEAEGLLLWLQDVGTNAVVWTVCGFATDVLLRPTFAQAASPNAIDWSSKCANCTLTPWVSNSSSVEEISVNLVFIPEKNRTSEIDWDFITATSDPEILRRRIITPLINWTQIMQGKGRVTLWLDPAMENPQALENTYQLIQEEFFSKNLSLSNLVIGNIRTIPTIENNKRLLEETIDIYVRVDFVRVVATLLAAERGPALYADLDIPGFSFEHILPRLISEPFIFISGHGKGLPVENGVFIFAPWGKEIITNSLIEPAITIINKTIGEELILGEELIYGLTYLTCFSFRAQEDILRIKRIELFRANSFYLFQNGEPIEALPVEELIYGNHHKDEYSVAELLNTEDIKKWNAQGFREAISFLSILCQELKRRISVCPSMVVDTSIAAPREEL